MDKVIIQEIAEEAGLSNGELIKKAKELGFNVKAANSTISMDDAGVLVDYTISGTLPKGFKKQGEKPKLKVVKKKAAEEAPEQNDETEVVTESTPKKKSNWRNIKVVAKATSKQKIHTSTKSSQTNNTISSSSAQHSSRSINNMVTAITNLITRINQNHENYGKPIIFENTNDAALHLMQMNTICTTQEQFNTFSSALYKTLLERTKENKKVLAKLPNNYGRNHLFVILVDEVRHIYSHDTTHSNWESQMDRGKVMYALKGNKLEPKDNNDFIIMQKALLKEFVSYLEELDVHFSKELQQL